MVEFGGEPPEDRMGHVRQVRMRADAILIMRRD
jgi:hypothetical protein